MTVALGIAPDSSGTGVDPLTHRKLIMGHWNNVGIISNSRSKADEMPLNVTGRSDLRYDVAAGAAVCSRGRADGYTEAYWAGGQSPAIPTPDPNNGRCDYVWIRANDPTQGGSSNQVEIGVTAGTPAANPGYPKWPSDGKRARRGDVDQAVRDLAGQLGFGGGRQPLQDCRRRQ